MLRVSLLGDFQLSYNDMPVKDVNTSRLQSLLAYLILHRDAPQSRAHLAFLFWPDTSEAQARTNLRNLLHSLRRTLPEADTYLDSTVQTLEWRNDTPFILDVIVFKTAISHAEQAQRMGDSITARGALERVVSTYKGDLLPSCYDDWIIPLREGLRHAYLSALEQLIHFAEDQCDYQAAIGNAQRLLQYDPLHEATYRQLIRLHALSGERAAALRVYHTCATVLQRELGVEPGTATREAYQLLLGAKTSSTIKRTTAFSPVVGREREWTLMLQSWRTVVAGGDARVVMLCGEAGIGKTRLVEELLQWAARQGIVSSSTRCYAAEGDLTYAPVSAWLRAHPLMPIEDIWLVEVARLLPEILTQRPDIPRPGALTEAWQRQRLFEALSRAILGTNQPLLLTIDDLQWCDRDTLEWLHFLLRFDREAKILVVGTYRPEEIDENHPLVSTLQALRKEGRVTEVNLQALDEAATKALATIVAGLDISDETARLLYMETEGNPLFVIETVRAGFPIYGKKLDIELDGSRVGEMGLPPKVQALLEARLAQISPPARELTGLAATIGREFSFKLLAKASNCDEDTLVHELDELWQRRIVREHGADAYDFCHDKLREVAYRGMSAAHRRLLHHHVAQGLETLYMTDLNPVCHQVATHYEQANLPEKAIPYYLRAAKMARQVYANDEAISLLQHALKLVQDHVLNMGGSELDNGVITLIWEELGDVLELRAQHAESLDAYQTARIFVTHGDRIQAARLHRKAGVVLREQRLYADALAMYNQAESALGEVPETKDNAWLREWIDVQVERIWAHYWLAQWPEMETLVNKAQPVVQEIGGPASRARFLMASCLLHLRRERYTVSNAMMVDLNEALAASRDWGDFKTMVECQFEAGFLHLWRGEFEEAEAGLRAALELTETSGIVPLQSLSLTYLTVLYRFRDQIDSVLKYALRAQELSENAHMPDYVAAAKGNQAWLAWRRGDYVAVEQRGLEALRIWQHSPLVYPFQWQALWPLIGAAMIHGLDDETWLYIKMLLDPLQQLLPGELNHILLAAVQAKENGQGQAASQHLACAVDIAREIGYL